MKLKISVILVLIYILYMQSILCSPIPPHVNYDEADVKGISLSLISKYIFEKILVGEGIAVNISLVLSYIDVVSIPEYLKTRLKAMLGYIDDFNKTISIAENEIETAKIYLKEKYLDLAENVLKRIENHIYNASITLYKVKLIVKDILASYPYLSSIIDPKIDMLENRLEKCISAYKDLYKIFEKLNQKFINRVKTIIGLNLSSYIVYPSEYIDVSGFLETENGTRLLDKYINILVVNTPISRKIRTDLNGMFRCMIKAPSVPGKYFVEAYYLPENPYLKYAKRRVKFTVKNIEVKIIVTNYSKTLYPQQRLTINGFIEPKIKWNNTDGEIVVNLFGKQFKTNVVNKIFNFTAIIPYNIVEGEYKVKLTYIPRDKALSKNSTIISINIANPPYMLDFKIDIPNIILNIFGLSIGFKPICRLQSNITVYVKMFSDKGTLFNKMYQVNVNESKNIYIDIPYQIETGNYIVEITGVPKNPLIKYEYRRINIFILNINSLIISLTAISFLTIYIALKIKGRQIYREEVGGIVKPKVKPIVLAKIEELSLSEKSLHKSILIIETFVSKILGIEIEPGDTHREICRKIYLKNSMIGELLLNTIYIFERSYYGLKILLENELKIARNFLQKILQYLRGRRYE